MASKQTLEKIPVISVVMGVYNGGAYLQAAIQSILDQTFRDFEFIIVDDGSTDKSAQTIRSFNDPRIVLIHHKTNQGLVASLNDGISHARGEYIARMDADDLSMPSRFEEELKLMTYRKDVGVVGTFFSYIDEQGKSLPHTVVSPTKSIDLKRSLYVVNPFGHGSTMIRRVALNEVGLYSDQYGPTEDFELWWRLAKSWELAVIPKVLYRYRINSQGISQQKQKIQHEFTAKIIDEQWRLPFLNKKLSDITADGRYYYSLDRDSEDKIYDLYAREQFVIAVELYTRGMFWTGLVTSLGAIWLDRNAALSLVRPTIGGFLRIIGLRRIKS